MRLLSPTEIREVLPAEAAAFAGPISGDADRSPARHERGVRALRGGTEQSRYGCVAGARVNEAARSEGAR